MANYTEVEYNRHLTDAGWSRPETDHLMDLAQRFDLRFIVMADRWDANTYKERSVEDLKERWCDVEFLKYFSLKTSSTKTVNSSFKLQTFL